MLDRLFVIYSMSHNIDFVTLRYLNKDANSYVLIRNFAPRMGDNTLKTIKGISGLVVLRAYEKSSILPRTKHL